MRMCQEFLCFKKEIKVISWVVSIIHFSYEIGRNIWEMTTCSSSSSCERDSLLHMNRYIC